MSIVNQRGFEVGDFVYAKVRFLEMPKFNARQLDGDYFVLPKSIVRGLARKVLAVDSGYVHLKYKGKIYPVDNASVMLLDKKGAY